MDLEFITHQQKCVCVRVMKLKVNLSSPQTIRYYTWCRLLWSTWTGVSEIILFKTGGGCLLLIKFVKRNNKMKGILSKDTRGLTKKLMQQQPHYTSHYARSYEKGVAICAEGSN